MHSAGLFSTQRTNEKVTENVFVPIEFLLDIVRQNRRSGRARGIIWIQDSQHSLAADGPKSNARSPVINGQPAMHIKASSDYIGTRATRGCLSKSRLCDRVVRDQQSKNRYHNGFRVTRHNGIDRSQVAEFQCLFGYWCSLAFHSHRGFSPVIGRPDANPSSRFNGFRPDYEGKPFKR